jgi:CBS domain-containing protein
MEQRTVGAVMTRDVVTVHPDTPFKQVVRVLADRGADAAPVVDETGVLLGMVSGADLTCHEEEPPRLTELVVGGRTVREHARKRRGRTARELMTSPVRTVHPETEVCTALREMGRGKVGRLVVVDGDRVVGMLTRSDVLRIFLRTDTELQREVEQVVREHVGATPAEVNVVVADGVAYLRGWVERTSCAWSAAGAAREVPGVVDVEDELSCQVDDTLVHEMSVRGPFA